MYLRAEITTSCRSENTKYIRLNMLGWALLCPYARDLIWHGAIPFHQPDYPTADESKALHEELRNQVNSIFEDGQIIRILNVEKEYEHSIGIWLRPSENKGRDTFVCAKSKADLVYTAWSGKRLFTLYTEVSSTRINVVKPWQAILRGISLYYERRLPVGIIIVSPEKIMYKLLNDGDQTRVLSLINIPSDDYPSNPNLCSLCELIKSCPFRAI